MAKVFISYSHRDSECCQRVQEHLNFLTGQDVYAWSDTGIEAGSDWREAIDTALLGCDCALLLISRHFFNSSFIMEQEVPVLLQRRSTHGIRLIPVFVSPCDWKCFDWLTPIQGRPSDGSFLAQMSDSDVDRVLSALATEVRELMSESRTKAEIFSNRPQVDLGHLPKGAEHFIGRGAELAQLHAAWAQEGAAKGIDLVTLIAPGGTGKTSLLQRWLDELKAQQWPGAQRVYAWSFYSQGAGEDRQASEDQFLDAAIDWFGVAVAESADAYTKGQRLAEALQAKATLLLLDGCEPLQYPPGHTLAGELKGPGLQALLKALSRNGNPGLCVLSSREALSDIVDDVRSASHSHGSVLQIDLGNLSEADGAQLLHRLGVQRAGAAKITADDAELREASREVEGHALTLSLLGSYLALAEDGNVRRRDLITYPDANAQVLRGHAFRVIAAYEHWLASDDKNGPRLRAALYLLGFFDRCRPRKAKRRPVVPGSDQGALFTRRRERRRGNKVVLRISRPAI